MGFHCERELETEQNWNILTPKLWPSALCLSCSSDAQPEALGSTLLGTRFLYCILSVCSLDPNSSGLPEGPFGRVWLSLPHLVSNSVRSSTPLPRRTQLSYIIVRRPLYLWNRMFNRHTVQRSLSSGASVYECTMGIFFSSSHFISQFPLITAIRMCHLLPVHHLQWHFGRVKGQNTTQIKPNKIKIKR